MEFFEGYKWALPHAFKSTIESCFFIEGYVLFDKREGYLQWNEALKHLSYSIQILLPKKPQNVAGSDGLKQKFLFPENWSKGVSFCITDYKDNSSKTIHTTQGRLLTFLKNGDFKVLGPDTPPLECPIKKGPAELKKYKFI